MQTVFWLSLLLLYHVYDGYLRLLRLLPARHAPQPPAQGEWPRLTVLVTAYNEAHHIAARLENVLACRYPPDRLEVLVASDGSTDGTDDVVKACGDPRVRLFRPQDRVGKTDTQNRAIATVDSELLLFTDADTRFDPGFLEAMARPFADPAVGCVTGQLLFVPDPASPISGSQGYYWNYELRLRQEESARGLLAVASGACMAIRRSLFRPMAAAYGEDCIVPLDVAEQGARVVHAADALAWDRMPATGRGEFRTRVRMTLRNWQGTWARPALLNPLAHPGYAFALWSHKLLRWLSPFFLLAAAASAAWLAPGSMLYAAMAAGFGLLLALGVAGWLAERVGRRIPLAGVAYSFLLANLGFLVGVLKALRGASVVRYK